MKYFPTGGAGKDMKTIFKYKKLFIGVVSKNFTIEEFYNWS